MFWNKKQDICYQQCLLHHRIIVLSHWLNFVATRLHDHLVIWCQWTLFIHCEDMIYLLVSQKVWELIILAVSWFPFSLKIRMIWWSLCVYWEFLLGSCGIGVDILLESCLTIDLRRVLNSWAVIGLILTGIFILLPSEVALYGSLVFTMVGEGIDS